MARRVLVVEDDEKSRRLLVDVLTHRGYEVLACESGEEALQAASVARPDAALLDIQLPRASGFLVLEGLRALHGAIPVLAVTASVMDQDRRRILDAGFDAYVAKPVNIHQLLEILEDRLEQHKP